MRIGRWLLLALTMWAALGLMAQSAAPRSLLNGAKLRITGTILVERRGNQAFLMLRTSEPYTADFGEHEPPRTVRELGLNLAGQSAALRSKIGQTVTVIGMVQLEPVSPYYFNGTLLQAESVQLPGGQILLPRHNDSATPLPPTIRRYYGEASFSPASGSFSYSIWDENGQPIPRAEGYLFCSLNGSGEIINCFCGTGFNVTAQGRMNGNRFIASEKQQNDGLAQFELPEKLRHAVHEAVECTREPAK